MYAIKGAPKKEKTYNLLSKWNSAEDEEECGVGYSAWGFYSDVVTLEPSENGYLVVCINAETGREGRFRLTCASELERLSVCEFEKTHYKAVAKTLFGKWNGNSAGGCSCFPTFHENP